MMVTVVTGWSPQGYEDYGRRFLETFHRYWPKEIDLLVYGEETVSLPRGRFISLSSVATIDSFLLRHKDNAAVHGTEPNAAWKPKDRIRGYNFRFDAYKFCKMAMIPYHAVLLMKDKSTHLVWMDADVVTLKTIPKGFVQSLLPRNKSVTFLGRRNYHSETGFVVFRIPEAIKLVCAWHDTYAYDKFLKLPEWHSAYIFDYCLAKSTVESLNLTPAGQGHVFVQSPLNEYMDHLKGPRKQLRESPDRAMARAARK